MRSFTTRTQEGLYLLFFLTAFSAFCCTPDESLPGVRSSANSAMDGTHYVPFSGVPDQVSATTPLDSSVAPGGWSTPPVALAGPYGFAVGTRNGRVAIFNDRDSLAGVIDVGSHQMVDQLLVDSSVLIAIALDGGLSAFSPDGKQLWRSASPAHITGPAIVASGSLVIPCEDRVASFSARSGSAGWHYRTSCSAQSLAFANETIAVAASHNDPNVADTIALLGLDGKPAGAVAVGGRLTANVALCGGYHNTLALGLLGPADNNWRPSILKTFDISDRAKIRLIGMHELPYIIFSIGANATAIFTNGIRTVESEEVSGADAFSLSDTSKLWSRRFVWPLAAPMAISNGDLYFTMTYQTEAIVASKGLFVTLSAGTGRTTSERPIKGVMSGFVPGMPAPDDRGRLLVADREKLVVYILDRSTLKRVF